ncbi:MAG: hypothetical protein ACYS5V_08995 [Planctomycetota bacterium]
MGKALAGGLVLIAMGMLTAAVLGPEYAELVDLRARKAQMAHQLACERRLARYNERLIHGLRTDPVLRAREAIRRRNYTPVGYRTVPLAGGPELSVPQRIGSEAAAGPPRSADVLARAGRWLGHPPTRNALVLISLGMLAATLVLFPSQPTPLKEPGTEGRDATRRLRWASPSR